VFSITPPPTSSPLFPYTTLFRSQVRRLRARAWPYCQRSMRPDPRAALSGLSCSHRIEPRDWPSAVVAACVNRLHIEEQRRRPARSEEHTSELQSRENLVCRLLLE